MTGAMMVGIDVSKDKLSWALVQAGRKAPLVEDEVANTPSGIDRIARRTPVEVPWVVEPTGRHSRGVVQRGCELQRAVLLAPPKEARAYLRSLNPRAKTDKIDSKGLASFGLSRELRPFPLKSEPLEHLGQLLSARVGISRAICSLHQQSGELAAARPVLRDAIADLHARRKLLDAEIRRALRDVPELAVAKEMQQVPGVGLVVSATAAACLAAKGFTHPDQFVAYVGLDIRVAQSGKRRGELGLTKHGHAELRRLLYIAAQSGVHAAGSPFRAQYEREQAKGLSKTASLCAVARKIAKLCWALHAHGSQYDPQRVYMVPTSPGSHTGASQLASTEPIAEHRPTNHLPN